MREHVASGLARRDGKRPSMCSGVLPLLRLKMNIQEETKFAADLDQSADTGALSLKYTTTPSVSADSRYGAGESIAQAIVLTVLYSAPTIWLFSTFNACLDNDIWWHLATGKWILQNHAIPHTDPFSAYGLGRSWAAYSWAFDLPLAWLVAHLGFVGLLLLQVVLVTAIIVALHRLIAALVPDFTLSVLLTFAAAIAMSRVFTPRPWLLTILFFILELHLVSRARENGDYRRLLWLPLIFWAWANLHVQFIYGLFVLMLAVGEAWWSWWKARCDPVQHRVRNLWTATIIGCIAATLVNPYFVEIYKVAYQLGTLPGVLNQISELNAVPFRSLSDYVLLLIALCAVGAFVWQRELRPFPWALLLWAIFFSFRSQRDIWLLAVVGTAVIATGLRDHAVLTPRDSRLQSSWVALGVVVVIAVGCRILGPSVGEQQRKIAATFPSAAVEFVKEKGLPGPLFNDYDWGGYLIWSLPEIPVSMDGRALLHGTRRLERSADTWEAHEDWRSDSELQKARLIIGPVNAPLCAVLRMDPQYQLAYEDRVASVFVRRTDR